MLGLNGKQFLSMQESFLQMHSGSLKVLNLERDYQKHNSPISRSLPRGSGVFTGCLRRQAD
jgi:hypothetical protein